MKPGFSPGLKELLTGLLEKSPEARLSIGSSVQRHVFFKGLDWVAMSNKLTKPPFKPRVVNS
jgi:hypothetical protein